MKITKATIDRFTLEPGHSERLEFDDHIPGYGLRLRAGDGKGPRYVFQYRNRRMSLGLCSATDPVQMRRRVSELYHRVQLGEDPAAEKAEARARSAETFGECVRTYLAWRRPQVRVKTYGDMARHLLHNLQALHSVNILDVDRRAIAAQLSRIATTTPTQANRTRASLSAFLNWAAGEGLVENNAALHTNKQGESEPRDRVLSGAEITQLFRALPDGEYGDILKLLLLSGQRANEIAWLVWSEIDFDRGVIELPPERTKNGRRHCLPMSDMMRAILEAQPHREGRALVFGAGEGGFSNWHRAKLELDAKLKISPWRVHDLRRTCATGMADLGVQPHVIEAVLNHVTGSKAGVAGIYNRSTYESEKRTALTLWADHVTGEPGKIVPIRRA